jgi:glycerol-3-phosphate dehydrogenase
LENLELGLVFHACTERRRLRMMAPHLVRPLPFLFTVYRSGRLSPTKVSLALWLYDALSLFRTIQRHRMLHPKEALASEPLLRREGLLVVGRYYDCSADDARLTLVTIISSHLHGAVIANYAAVVGLLKAKGKVCGAEVLDRINGREVEVRARVVVNATGPWVDGIRRLDDPKATSRLRPTKGIHIILPRERLHTSEAIAFTSPRDGRLMFVIPWGSCAIVGTTDTDYEGDFDSVCASREDVDYVLEALEENFPDAGITDDDILSTFAGLRPLVREEGVATFKVSRRHQIMLSPSGLVSIAGGKLTTYRAMAEELVSEVAKILAKEHGVLPKRGCITDKVPLVEGNVEAILAEIEMAKEERVLDEDVAAYLFQAYGPDSFRLLQLITQDRMLGERIVSGLPYIKAEVIHAIRYEMALTLCDFMIRRTRLIYEAPDQGLGKAQEVAEIMAPHLGWGSGEIERQLTLYRDEVALVRA